MHCHGHIVVKCLIILTNLSLFAPAFAQKADLKDYTVSSGLVDVQPGALVEGSARQGGIQPDYYVDTFSEPIRSFLERMEDYKDLVSV